MSQSFISSPWASVSWWTSCRRWTWASSGWCKGNIYTERDMATRRIFRGFCRNLFGNGPLHYISSCSDFGFELAEIFLIEKWPTVCLWLGKSGSHRPPDSSSRLLHVWKKTPLWWFGESSSPRIGESGSRYSKFVIFIINFPNFKRLNQPFKGAQVWDSRSLRFSLFLHHKAFLGRWLCG